MTQENVTTRKYYHFGSTSLITHANMQVYSEMKYMLYDEMCLVSGQSDTEAGVDAIGVGLSLATLIATAPEVTPIAGYALGEVVASLFVQFGNVLATGATIASVGAEMINGNSRFALAIESTSIEINIHSDIYLGNRLLVGGSLTGVGGGQVYRLISH